MKIVFIALFLQLALLSTAQDQLNQAKTVIDLPDNRWLDSLLEAVGEKRIVALGEDTHGTAEYYELRDLITRRLIKEKGFNVVILENPHEDMMALQQGLRKIKLDTLMRRHLFSIYQTRQMKDFLQWFKKYSKNRKELKLTGCDDSYRELLPLALVKEIRRYGDKELNKLCQTFLLRQTLDVTGYYKRFPLSNRDSLPDEMAYGLGTYRLLENIDSLYSRQAIKNPAIKELIFHAKTAYVFYERFARKARVSRDEIMGDRINYYAADPKAKIIVWAHSGHIAKYAWLNNELGLMGATVQKMYPSDYLAIGMSSSEGSYSYIKNRFINNDHHYTDSLFTGDLQKNKTGSWNELLSAGDTKNYFLDFSKVPVNDRTEFEKEKHFRLMGYGKQSETWKEYYPVSLPRLFDVLIFLKKTSHTTALFN